MRHVDCEVLLPVHNEGQSIESTILGIYGALSVNLRVGFIICEDGSKDNTKEVLRSLAERIPMRLNLSDARKGYSKAVREGMAMLEAEYILCLDSDGQCDPSDFAAFWDNRGSADIIIGRRVHRADTILRRLFSRTFYILYQAAFRTKVHDPSCPFVLFPKVVAQRLAGELGAMQEGFWWEFVARAHRRGFTIRELPVNHKVRAAGVTQVYGFIKMPGIFFRHVGALLTIWRETRPKA